MKRERPRNLREGGIVAFDDLSGRPGVLITIEKRRAKERKKKTGVRRKKNGKVRKRQKVTPKILANTTTWVGSIG